MDIIFRKALKQDLQEVVTLYQKAIAHLIERKINQWDEIYPQWHEDSCLNVYLKM